MSDVFTKVASKVGIFESIAEVRKLACKIMILHSKLCESSTFESSKVSIRNFRHSRSPFEGGEECVKSILYRSGF